MFLGIDFGKKRIGLALGEVLPYGAGVIDASQNQSLVIEQILDICKKNEVEKIIIGMPIRSQGEKGTIANLIEKFASDLKQKSGLPIVFEPEQFSTAEATKELISNGKKYTRKGGEIDELSAIIILEQYLNTKNEKKH